MLIRYVCECCDRIIEEILVREDVIDLVSDDDDDSSFLTQDVPEDIMGMGNQGSLLLRTMCPECLSELEFDEGGTLAFKTQIIN